MKVVFAWTRQVCALLGASYEVWTGAEATVVANVRFAAQARREFRAERYADQLSKLHGPISIHKAETLLRRSGVERPRHLVLELLWPGHG